MGSNLLVGIIATSAITVLVGQVFAQDGSADADTSMELRASAPALSVTLSSTDGTCSGSRFSIEYGWTATTNDPGDGTDVVGMIAYDWTGAPISADWAGIDVGTTDSFSVPFGSGTGIAPILSRPIKIEVYDIVTFPPFGSNTQGIFNAIQAQAVTVPLMTSIEYDPSIDVPNCVNLPILNDSPQISIEGGFMKLDTTQGTSPIVGFCTEPDHYGRMQFDEVNEILYACGQSGWVPINAPTL